MEGTVVKFNPVFFKFDMKVDPFTASFLLLLFLGLTPVSLFLGEY
jgi:hypothetical protein